MKVGTRIGVGALVLHLSLAGGVAPAYAMGKPNPSSGGGQGSDVQNLLTTAQVIAINVAIIYAQTDPRFAPILAALNIKTADDVGRLLKGDLSGLNLQNVVSYYLITYGKSNPEIASVLDQLNIRSLADLQNLFKQQNLGSQIALLSDLAYKYASQNRKYAPWLSALGIRSGADLSRMLQGGFQPNNLVATLVSIGVAYMVSHKKAKSASDALYASLILGAFQGLDASEVSAISQALAGAAVAK